MKRRDILVTVVCLVFALAGCSTAAMEGSVSSEADVEQEAYYDPSVENYISYARALGQGYENDWGSKKIAVGKNTTVFIGDSFFDRRNFWTGFYVNDYKDADAFCAGIASTTVADWKCLLNEVLAVCGKTPPKNIAIHLGTNDLWSNTRYYIVDGLESIFTSIHQKFPETTLFYFGITHRADNSQSEKTDDVNSEIAEWCESQTYITYVNTPDKITADMLQPVGLHPKFETYSVFAAELVKAGCTVMDRSGQPFLHSDIK